MSELIYFVHLAFADPVLYSSSCLELATYVFGLKSIYSKEIIVFC